uniref:GHMP kinase N-terminal domain-containing protein n=1 Tax=Brassica oleracea var. oleracea TaxID=109376 RepID=A0A0D3EFJ1_BRAOL
MDPNPEPASSGDENNNDVLEYRSFARIGFLGNPSDVYFGRTISFTIGNFWASAKLEPSDHLLIKPHPFHDLVRFDSLDNLVCRLKNEGYYGGVRLLMAICKVFRSYCKDNDIRLHDRNFTLSYDTNIPRQTGLSGSSAIVSAALSCLLDYYNVFKTVLLKSMVVVLFTCKDHMDRVGYGIYTIMDINLLPPLHLIYAENPSDSGKLGSGFSETCLSTVRRKWLDGDEFIISSMAEIAKLAEEGRTALLNKDYTKLKELMNRNFDLRRIMFGDECLGAMNIEMVEVARKIGAAAKFTGSGGAMVAFCPDGPSQVKLLEEECKKAGFIVEPVKLVPTRLNNSDLKTLSNP